MIRPKKNFIIHWFLHNYVRWIIKINFHGLIYNDIETDRNKSILLLANHFSFWDSLILYMVSNKLLKKDFYVMVREDTTVHMQFVKYGGAFSINKSSREMLGSLDYAAKLLNDPQNLVLVFPQGKLYSNFVNDINFEKGVMKIIKQAEGKFQLIFAATFTQYLKHKKPTATVYLKEEPYQGKSLEELKNAYQRHYNNTKLQQTEIVI